MRKAALGLAVLLFTAPALAGCMSEDTGPESPGSDLQHEAPQLATGVAFGSLEPARADARSITFFWNATAAQGSAVSPTTAGAIQSTDATTAPLTLPQEGRYRLLVELNWSADDRLVLQLRDPTGQVRCLTSTEEYAFRPATCGFAELSGHTDTGTWTVSISARPGSAGIPSAEEVPFMVRVEVGAVPVSGEGELEGEVVHVVLGFEDSGINPYHEAFRDNSPLAHEHPSTYLGGYPTDASALNLSLDAESYDEAVEADSDIWNSIETGRLYWIPGTKIVGAVALQLTPTTEGDCMPILDCYGHGTNTIARAIGPDLSLCPECRVTVVSDGPVGTPWLASAPWVDVIVDEFVDEVAVDRSMYEAIATRRPLVAPAMNYPVPAARYNFHAPATISVGGHDSGRPVPSQGYVPHVVADSCRVETASPTSIQETDFVSGTSYSTPFVAGAIGAIIRDVRESLQDSSVGIHDGVIASGEVDPDLLGPLADGELSLIELREVLYATADPRPGTAQHDGLTCFGLPAAGLPEQTQDVPTYQWFGYGAVNEHTIEHVKRVLGGEQEMPERPVEDAFFALDQEVRNVLMEVDP